MASAAPHGFPGAGPGHLRPRPTKTVWTTVIVLAVLGLIGAMLAVSAVDHGAGSADEFTVDAAASGEIPPAPPVVPVDETDDSDGPLADFPTERTGVGFVHLGDPVEEVHAELAEPDAIEPDVSGWMHRWDLAGGAEFGVSTWEDDTYEVAGLSAVVPDGSDVTMALYGGVVLGESTVGEIVEAFGPDAEPSTHEHDDYVVQYVGCIGAFPVIVKIDAAGADEQGLLGPAAFDLPATRILTGFVDGPPGQLGCGAESA